MEKIEEVSNGEKVIEKRISEIKKKQKQKLGELREKQNKDLESDKVHFQKE